MPEITQGRELVGTVALLFSVLGVAGGDGELRCLCGTSHLCDGSTHSSGCVVDGSNAMAAF